MSFTFAFSQNDITGFWAHPAQERDYFQYDGLFLTEDGYYYAEKVYSEMYQEIVFPEFSLGVYEVQNDELKLYDIKGDRYLTYQLSFLDQQQLQLTDPNDNELKITAIDSNESLIYTGQIISFSQTDYVLLNKDGEEQFNYQGKLNLNANEELMVHQYMKMNNRLAMTTVDMIDGVQDFI